jgi:hypothetical protein
MKKRENATERPTMPESAIETTNEKYGCFFYRFFVYVPVLFGAIDHDFLRSCYGYGYGCDCGCGSAFLSFCCCSFETMEIPWK